MSSDHEPMPEGEEQVPKGAKAMAVVRWGLVAAMAVAAAASLAVYAGLFASAHEQASRYYCPMHPQIVQPTPGDCPICGMSLVPASAAASPRPTATAPATPGAYWCPMHPDVASDDPNAKCDKCGGMKLLPRKDAPPESDVPGLTAVDLSPERVQLMGMRTAPAIREQLAPAVRSVGYVTAREDGQTQVSARFAGWIEELHVGETGQRVRKGQVLATLYSPELLTVQQELLNARSWGSGTGAVNQGLADDARHRLELLGVGSEDIDELLRTGKPLRAVALRSPVNGHVVQKNAVRGAYTQAGVELFRVADLSRVWVLVEVFEQDMGRVREGTKAELRLAAYPEQRFSGRVAFIYPSLDPATRTLRARVELNNPELTLKPGMYGEVVLELPTAEGLTVPLDAVVDTGEATYVFLAAEAGRFAPRRVRLGLVTEERVEILEGLKEGDVVVTTANFLIDSESRLRSAISGQGARPSEAPPAPAPQHKH